MAWTNGRTRTSDPRHKQWRAAVLRNADGRCQINGPTCTGRADQADHIVPVAEGGAEHDVSNGQGACTACHDVKTAAEAARGLRRHYRRAKRAPEVHPALRDPS